MSSRKIIYLITGVLLLMFAGCGEIDSVNVIDEKLSQDPGDPDAGSVEIVIEKKLDSGLGFEEIVLDRVKQGTGYTYDKTLTLSGDYVFYAQDAAFIGNMVCFVPDVESSKLLPSVKGDQRSKSFCFQELDAAQKFGLQEPLKGAESCLKGKATILVNDYFIALRPVEAGNGVRLEKIISRTEPDFYQKCDWL